MMTMTKCWWCENEVVEGESDTVVERGELMHKVCRDAHVRERELQGTQDKEGDPQA